jgi:SSS family transporter
VDIGEYPYASWVFIGVLIYMVAMVGIGVYSSKRVKGISDFLVAGRRLGFILATGTLFATWFGAGTAMGGAANAYLFGFQGVVADPFGAAFCLIIAGLFFARLMRRARYLTLADFFQIRYGAGMGFASVITLSIAEMGWVGAQLVGFGTILHLFSGIPLSWGIIISAGVLVIYTFLGGMWSVTLTDFVQMVILIAGFLVLFPIVLGDIGGWDYFINNAGNWAEMPPFALWPEGDAGFFGYTGSLGWVYAIAFWLSIMLGSIPAQDLMQRMLSARNESVAVLSSYTAGIMYLTIGLLPVLLGMMAFEIMPDLSVPETEMILPWLAVNYLHPLGTVIFVAALIAALMSSSDSAILAASSLIGYNGLKYFKPDSTEEEQLKITRIMVPIITVASLLLALYAETIYRLMVIAWTVLLVGLFAPYAAGYFWKKANRYGAWAAFIGGFVSWILFSYYFLPTTIEANIGIIEEGVVYWDWAIWDAVYLGSVPGFIVSIVLLFLVSLLTQKIDPPMPLRDMDGNPLEVEDYLGIVGPSSGSGTES